MHGRRISVSIGSTRPALLSHLIYHSPHLIEMKRFGETEKSVDFNAECSTFYDQPTYSWQYLQLSRPPIDRAVESLFRNRFNSGFVHLQGSPSIIPHSRHPLSLKRSVLSPTHPTP